MMSGIKRLFSAGQQGGDAHPSRAASLRTGGATA